MRKGDEESVTKVKRNSDAVIFRDDTTITAATSSNTVVEEEEKNNNRPNLQKTLSFPLSAATALGSITGHRSESGTMSDLHVSGSFDMMNKSNSSGSGDTDDNLNNPSTGTGRERANTAPAITQHQQQQQKIDTTPNDDNNNNNKNVTTVAEEEEDEDVKFAMAMALAIQNNPNLTPAEVHELVAGMQRQPQVQQPKKQQQQQPSTQQPQQQQQQKETNITKTSSTTATTNTSGATTKTSNTTTTATTKKENINANTTTATTTTSNTTAPTKKGFLSTTKEKLSLSTKIPAAAAAASSSTRSISSRTINSNNTAAVVTAPTVIRLKGVGWKRRGGMGKYSHTAWERRKFELHGTKLFYYLVDNTTNIDGSEHNYSDDDNTNIIESVPSTDSVSTNTTRKFWFDHANAWGAAATSAMNIVSTATTDNNSTDQHNHRHLPRGYLDLAKEKAAVHAAFGHSGAPSPFAISIKVRGETKWKLCFDRHSTQMEWLSALSDVVVQVSVDTYNAGLLEAADPTANVYNPANALTMLQLGTTSDHNNYNSNNAPSSNISNNPLYHHPPITNKNVGGTQHRLWMLESYRVGSMDFISSEDDENDNQSNSNRQIMDDTSERMVRTTETDLQKQEQAFTEGTTMINNELSDDSQAQQIAEEQAEKTWIIPEEKLWQTVVVLNICIIIGRATTLASFWYLVVCANVALYKCLVKNPHWKSVLTFVKTDRNATAATTTTTFSTITAKSRSKKAATSETLISSATTTIVQQQQQSTGYVPEAGCSSVKLDEPTDPPVNEKGEHFAGWRPMPGDILAVRSHGYADTKKKVPSPGELYECVAVDIFESPQRYPDMGPRVKLPKCEFDDDDGALKTWRCPDLFIISIALPTDPPKMGRSSSDGGGYTITMYYKMKPETRAILRRVTADGYDPSSETYDDIQTSKVNAVRLLEEWVRRAPTDPKFQARFKVVPNAHNLKEIGMPAWISKYNGKPFLIKRPGVTGFLYTHPELSCVEFDISLHPFPYLAKQGICFMKDSYFKRVLVTFGFVIEGRSDDELPECCIGLMQLCYPDPQYAIQASDFFKGTAPRSF